MLCFAPQYVCYALLHVNVMLCYIPCNFAFFLEINCGDVPLVAFARPGEVQTLVDSLVNFTCEVGHIFPDQSRTQTVTCTDTGQWEGRPLQVGCERKFNNSFNENK